MENSSFKKGEEFEYFVESNLFKETDYDLIYRTNTYNQNKNRFAEDSLKPDFKFRCKKTNLEFYVEAKYRSNFDLNNMIEIMSYQQLSRFKSLQEVENVPIFIVVGYEGYSSNPDNISLIPLEELDYLKLFPSFLKKYQIEKKLVDYKRIERNQIHENNNQEIIREKDAKANKFKIKSYYYFLISFFVLFGLGILFFNNNIEDKLKERTAQYYKFVEEGEINQLENYICSNVDAWYDKSNLSFEEISRDIKEYLKKYPETRTEVQWDTFEYVQIDNDYLCTYKLVYKIKSPGKFQNKVFHLKIKALWNKDLKLKSIVEKRL